MVEDWNEPPVYESAPRTAPSRPGTFTADRSRVSRKTCLASAELGFTAIYLNPHFEAASNHRYDTADYQRSIRFWAPSRTLLSCARRPKLGISIILDGVFNHTGDDSMTALTATATIPRCRRVAERGLHWRDAFISTRTARTTVGGAWAICPPSMRLELVRERLLGKDGVIRK